MDSLRYWILEMHVDGFRFDLAAALARELHDVDRLSTFFDLVQQDPVVSQVKLIAEPWDVGEGGYQVGNFPPLWTEWNGKYRDAVRDFWRGRPSSVPRLRVPAHRVQRPVRDERAPPRRLDQLRHLPRRVHPERPGSATTTSTTRPTARATGTAPTTTARGTAARRARPTIRPSTSCAPGRSGTSWSPCSCPRASRCCWPATRWAGPSRQQQRLLPGQRDVLAGLGPGRRRARTCCSSPRRWPACAATTRCSAGAGSSAARSRGPRRATSSGSPRPGSEMTDADWGASYAKSLGGVPQRGRDQRARPARREDHRRQLPAAVQRAQQAAHVHPARGRLRGRLGGRHRHRVRGPGAIHPPKEEIEVRDRAVVVLRSTE